MNIKAWIEAMRLRTLPVSISGVLAAIGYSLIEDCFNLIPAIICLLFAVLAQIASNFANEYYDFKGGLDKPGREGPRRGVTEGDITPHAMKVATFGVLGAACILGCSLIYWGGWWLIGAGLLIALGVLSYSTGPYPLSHHALGEIAVIFFFGIIPVNLTFYVMSGFFDLSVAIGSLAVGLLGANILLINNYRDMEDDASVNKKTVVVKFGRTFASTWYLLDGYGAVILMLPVWYMLIIEISVICAVVPVIYLIIHTLLWIKIQRLRGHSLNPFLGITAMLMLFYCLGFLICSL